MRIFYFYCCYTRPSTVRWFSSSIGNSAVGKFPSWTWYIDPQAWLQKDIHRSNPCTASMPWLHCLLRSSLCWSNLRHDQGHFPVGNIAKIRHQHQDWLGPKNKLDRQNHYRNFQEETWLRMLRLSLLLMLWSHPMLFQEESWLRMLL